MQLLTSIVTFIIGAAIGSFLSVLIYRIRHKKRGVLFSRSICPSCKKKLKWSHLIPVLSWVFLKGKCGYCDKKISSHYLALEIITGFLFLITFLNWNFLEPIASNTDPSLVNYIINWKIFEIFIFYILEGIFLIGIFFYDLMYKIIPDRFSFPAIGIAIAGNLVIEIMPVFDMAAGGALIFAFFAIQLIASKGRWIGGGDLRLGALMGLLLGWKIGLVALITAYLLGSIVGILLLIQKKATRKTAIPFGPFLVTGTFIAIFYGQQILDLYLNTLSF